jgi:dUTP pyrophosphatase
MKIKLKKLKQNAVIPKYSKIGDAGLDLVATSLFYEKDLICYGTGIAIQIPDGHVGLLYPRSSVSKVDLALSNSVGVIDSNYRGELIVKFRKTKSTPEIYLVGDRVAQLIITPFVQVDFENSEELEESSRGNLGFGSSGR